MNCSKKSFERISIGDKAHFSKTIAESDVYLYAGITGDFNPMHVNRTFAAQSIFGAPVAHGMLPAGLISTVLGTILPGPGTIYLSQTLEFKSPVRLNDTITATVEVVEKIEKKRRIRLKTLCHNQKDELVIQGEATVLISNDTD